MDGSLSSGQHWMPATVVGIQVGQGGDGERDAPPGLRARRIGTTSYLYNASAARHDGGRPWIRETSSREDERLAAELALRRHHGQPRACLKRRRQPV
jgi:hypothetical protein